MSHDVKHSQVVPLHNQGSVIPSPASYGNVAITHDAIPVRMSASPIPRNRNPAWRHIQAQESKVSRDNKRSQLNRIAQYFIGVPKPPKFVPPGVDKPDKRKVYPEQLHCIDFVHWEDFTGSVVQEALNSLRDHPDKPLSAASRNAFRALFRGVAQEAVMLGLMERETYERIKSIKLANSDKSSRGKAHPRFVLDAILTYCDSLNSAMGARDGVIFSLLATCGFRRAEACSIKLSDIDMVTREVHVTGKGNKDRTLKIADGTWQRLMHYLDHYRGREPGFLLTAIWRNGKRPKDVSKPLSVAMINKRLEKICGEVNQRLRHLLGSEHVDIAPHDYRRTYATTLLEAGLPLRAIQKLLGHSTVATTETYLFDATTGYRDDAADIFNKAFALSAQSDS
ncbi:tyrosine-type recombinase/integrase [Halomonas sp. KO116]|uniref:tyrosine-type recombinase/integrase n=1 Tax=Halomonas sp. KO116 TaxID=1504981 RepID=UPI0004E3FFF0|nr:site-specific integrase [Halomonas sp. KO116]AJY53206.1 integrase family protein [Halomonas sp. KO116]